MTLRELAETTPAARDRYVDFLRAASILAVVVGHWFIGIIWWQQGVIRTTSAIGETSWMWLATWFLQVMPVFFFVGGFSNLVSYDAARRRGETAWSFVRSRSMRLLKPSAVFLAVWTVVQIALHLADIGSEHAFLRGMLPPGATVPFGPLWFLPVYLAIIASVPGTLWLHRRYGVKVVIGLTLAAFAVDVIGFALHHPGVRYWNIVFVWLLPHQIGYFYGEGRLDRLRTPAFVAMALAGMAGLLLLTNPPIFAHHGPEWFSGLRAYPKSLLGTDVEPIANTYPPTIVIVAMTYWAIGVVMLIRAPVARWLSHTRPWMAVIFTNSVIMTLYLWHMTAYLLAVLVLWPLGFGHQHDTTARWWLERPLWIGVPGLFLAGLVAVFGRFERPKLRPKPAAATADIADVASRRSDVS